MKNHADDPQSSSTHGDRALVSVLRCLAEAKADMNATDGSGMNVMHYAANAR